MQDTIFIHAIYPYRIESIKENFLHLKVQLNWQLMLTFFLIWLFSWLVFTANHIALYDLTFESIAFTVLLLLLYLASLINNPKEIKLANGLVTLYYKNINGTYNEVNISSDELVGINPIVIRARVENITAIDLCRSSGENERLFFANKLYNYKVAFEYSEVIANKFSSILSVPVIRNKRPNQALKLTVASWVR